MNLCFCGDTNAIKDGLDIIKGRLGITFDTDGIKVNVKADNDSLEVSEKNGEYFIKFSRKAEFFRALSILSDKIKNGETDFSVRETAEFDTCGTMIDVSRNGVLTVKTAKDLAERFKDINLLMNAKKEDLVSIQDIGEIVAESIVNYFADEQNIGQVEGLLSLGFDIEYPKENKGGVFSGEKVVLTGTYPIFS